MLERVSVGKRISGSEEVLALNGTDTRRYDLGTIEPLFLELISNGGNFFILKSGLESGELNFLDGLFKGELVGRQIRRL
jgi:hypothetical protein